jgi:tetratricopeptide (TPR) repeat protein
MDSTRSPNDPSGYLESLMQAGQQSFKQFDDAMAAAMGLGEEPADRETSPFVAAANLQRDAVLQFWKFWNTTLVKALGVEGNVQPGKRDRRFKDEAWAENVVFDCIKQCYLLSARHLQSAVERVHGLDEHTTKKVQFYTRQFIDAMSPTNFAATNPEVLKATIESKGQNLLEVARLRVTARAASFHFRRTGGDVREIARHLGIAALLDGSVRKADNHLRITVQLVDVASGHQYWSERFDRTMADVFAMQDEIAQHVARRIGGGEVNGEERQRLVRPQTSAVAYEYYLRGRQHLVQMTRSSLTRSVELFRQATECDPHYGPAFAGLATAHATLYEWFGANEADLAGAEDASRRAVEEAPDLAEAHMARGCALALSRDYAEAARAFEDAIARNPQFFDSYYYFGRTAFAAGDIERSAELFRQASEVRLEDCQSPTLMGQSLQMLGRVDEARAAAREGVRRAERMLALNPADVRALSIGSIALFADGQHVRAMEWSQRALELNPDDTSTLVCAACVRIRSGLREQALVLLERVFEHGCGKRDWIEHDPDFDTLRGDPRFERLLAKLK